MKLKAVLLACAALCPGPALAQSASPEVANRRQQTEQQVQRAEEEQAPRRSTRQRSRPQWRIYASSGAFYSTGTFGLDRRTSSLFVPFTLRARKGPLRLFATLPYLHIRGSRRIIGGGDEGPIIDDPAVSTERETRSGLGDLSLRARYRVAPDAWDGVELDVLGRVKLPTGSEEKRLSTGEFDYSIGGELSYSRGRIQPFAEVQYRINGDPPGRDFRNTYATSIGANTRIGRRVNASLSYDYSRSRIRGRAGAHSLSASVSRPVSERLSLSGFGSVGLSERAEDFSVGTILSVRLR